MKIEHIVGVMVLTGIIAIGMVVVAGNKVSTMAKSPLHGSEDSSELSNPEGVKKEISHEGVLPNEAGGDGLNNRRVIKLPSFDKADDVAADIVLDMLKYDGKSTAVSSRDEFDVLAARIVVKMHEKSTSEESFRSVDKIFSADGIKYIPDGYHGRIMLFTMDPKDATRALALIKAAITIGIFEKETIEEIGEAHSLVQENSIPK